MQAKIVGTLALVLAALSGSMAAQAAGEILTYTSADFTSVYGNVSAGSDFTATVTLKTALGTNLKNALESSDVTGLVFTTVEGGKTVTQSFSATQAQGSSFYFTTNNLGQITGWDFTAGLTLPSSGSSDILFHSCYEDSCTSGNYNGQYYGATGDWYDSVPGTSSAADACTYTDIPNPQSPCGSSSTGNLVGSWAVAPELNASNAGTGLTLLFGGSAVLIGRRRGVLAAAV